MLKISQSQKGVIFLPSQRNTVSWWPLPDRNHQPRWLKTQGSREFLWWLGSDWHPWRRGFDPQLHSVGVRTETQIVVWRHTRGEDGRVIGVASTRQGPPGIVASIWSRRGNENPSKRRFRGNGVLPASWFLTTSQPPEPWDNTFLLFEATPFWVPAALANHCSFLLHVLSSHVNKKDARFLGFVIKSRRRRGSPLLGSPS